MKDEKFEQIREGIRQELLKANQHFKICWDIKRASEDIYKAIDVYLSFFYYTIWANNDRFCLGIYNVVKPDDDTANFIKLFNYIKSNKDLMKIFNRKEINEMEAIIQSHVGLIDKIKVIRDQYIAHNQLEKKHLKGEATYTYEEGKKLLCDLNKMLNTLSIKYDNNRYSWDTSPRLNVEDMLRHLTEYRNERIKKRRQGVIS